MSHRYNRTNLRRKKERAVVGNLFETIIYETKPFAMMAVVAVCANNHYATTGMAKFSIGLLFIAAAYIMYARLVHRGYLK